MHKYIYLCLWNVPGGFFYFFSTSEGPGSASASPQCMAGGLTCHYMSSLKVLFEPDFCWKENKSIPMIILRFISI